MSSIGGVRAGSSSSTQSAESSSGDADDNYSSSNSALGNSSARGNAPDYSPADQQSGSAQDDLAGDYRSNGALTSAEQIAGQPTTSESLGEKDTLFSQLSTSATNSLAIQNPGMGEFNVSGMRSIFQGLPLTGSDSLALGASVAQSSAEAPNIEPMIIEGTVEPRIPSALELGEAASRAQVRLNNGDRAGAYLELYKVTGTEQLLVQAQITTYSGAVGGMALEGNFRAKMANPENYDLTLDRFSHEIDQAVVDLARDTANKGKPEQFNKENIMEADAEVWNSNGMLLHFPGNAQQIGKEGKEHLAQSIGSQEAILSQDEIELGRRPAEYANDSRYSTVVSQDERFITVFNNETHGIESFFDTRFESDRGESVDAAMTPDLEQIGNDLPSARVKSERQAKMDFLQAGTFHKLGDLPAFDANAARPPVNLDRVFEYQGALFQVSDRSLMEAKGVDFKELTTMRGGEFRDRFQAVFGVEPGQMWAGIQYSTSLNEAGDAVESLINGTLPLDESYREHVLQQFINEGIVTALTTEEITYYEDTFSSTSEQGLQSPYQSSAQALSALENNLIFNR